MLAEKTLKEVVRALPPYLKMEETRGLGRTLKQQWGGPRNTRRIVRHIIAGGRGPLANLRDLGRQKMGKIVPNWILGMWETLSEREAVVDGARRISFGELKDRVLRLANALQSLGMAPRDRVAVMLPNSMEFLENLCACSLIGATTPFVNWHLRGEELRKMIDLRKPKALVFDAEFLDEVLAIREGLPSVEHYVVVGGEAPPEGILDYEELLKGQAATRPEMDFIVAFNPYTGGTTGTPKSSNLYDSLGFLLSDIAEPPRTSLREFMRYISLQFSFLYWYGGEHLRDEKTGNIRSLIVTPMYHAGTIVAWAPWMLLGATAVIMRRFEAEEFLR
ncbi:MAG: AMP-binding protein, partial [Actinobacteria bacterium]|nr:AMP-binding protein [Actinomycetota bacterium]